jgi:hypothetical protein
MTDETKQDIRDRLGEKLMRLFEAKLDAVPCELNATEQAVLARILIQSGWTIDPSRVPKGLLDKLTQNMDVNDAATADELGIIHIRKHA